jgi:methionine aminotransferase
MSKLPILAIIFTVMSQLAAEYNAINLSQGFPNFPVDERLTILLNWRKKMYINTRLCLAMYRYYQNSDTSQTLYGRTIQPETELLVTERHKLFYHHNSW